MANQQKQRGYSNPLGNFTYIAMAIGALIVLYVLAKAAFNLILWIAPFLFIATLFIDYKVVLDYGKWVLGLFKMNPLYGIGASVVTFFVFPVVAFFLFGKALLKKKVVSMKEQLDKKVNGEYTEYEEVPEDFVPDGETLIRKEDLVELPPIKPKVKQAQPKSNKSNEYEDLF